MSQKKPASLSWEYFSTCPYAVHSSGYDLARQQLFVYPRRHRAGTAGFRQHQKGGLVHHAGMLLHSDNVSLSSLYMSRLERTPSSWPSLAMCSWACNFLSARIFRSASRSRTTLSCLSPSCLRSPKRVSNACLATALRILADKFASADLMLRKPRNARTDRLTDWRFFVQIYLVRTISSTTYPKG
jgi:hypothetical protein